MKLGSVVTVCTNFRKGTHRSSFINTANSMGSQEVASVMPLMAKVFLRTCRSCWILIGFSTRDLNHFRPTKSWMEKGLGGL